MENKKGRVKATMTTFRVVEALRQEDGVRLTPLSDRLDMSKSSVYKYLRTLEDLGYVVRDGMEYYLGPEFARLGGQVIESPSLYTVARPRIDELAEQTGETVLLFETNVESVICLYRATDEWPPSVDIGLGEQFSLVDTRIGNVVLAYLPPDRIEALLDGAEWPITVDGRSFDRNEFPAELESIRDRGLAFERESNETARRSVSAPITDPDGYPCGVISIAAPGDRIHGKRLEIDLAGSIQTVASDLSNALVSNAE